MSELRIISGRQEPVPGSARYRAMTQLAEWLEANPAGATYLWLADNLSEMHGSVQRTQGAALDLHLFTDMVVSVPAPRNGYRVRAHWNGTARWGESNQSAHNATRAERQAIRLDKGSRAEDDPALAVMMRMTARAADTYAKDMRDLEKVMTARAEQNGHASV